MKKLLSSLFVISALLLSGIYLVGKMTESETRKIFAKVEQQGFSSKLLSYDKQFLKATAVSQVSVMREGGKPIVFSVKSTIQHYPHKASITNQIRLLDATLAEQVQGYFGTENWIRSTEEISLLGKLTGQLHLLPGSYNNAGEQITTKALQLDYQVNMQDYSGTFTLNWHGLDAQTREGNLSVQSVRLNSDFATLPIANEYNYSAEIAKVVIRQKSRQSQLQGVELLGSSRSGEQAATLDSSNEWKVATYRIDDGVENVFTDNHLKLDLKGLSAPALALLSRASGDQQQLAKALAELVAHGAQLSLTKLTSQTPWGEVNGEIDLTLQQGARLSAMIENPFMLLDYGSGSAKLFLPESLLQLPELSDLLEIGLRSGFLKRQAKTLSLETQFGQGELTINGRAIPL